MRGADVFIGVSRPGLVTAEMVATMAPQAILFPMANPTPEIFPDEAKRGGAAIVGTGRSDFANQALLIEIRTQRQIALATLFKTLGGGWLAAGKAGGE